MTTAKIKAGIWVQAQIRQCDLNCLPAYVARRGDPDAGAVVLKLDRLDDGVEVFVQTRTAEGALGWLRATGATPVDAAKADAYIERQIRFDPDVWVLEIEDPRRRYEFDGEIVS
jgi:hypothetical protein